MKAFHSNQRLRSVAWIANATGVFASLLPKPLNFCATLALNLGDLLYGVLAKLLTCPLSLFYLFFLFGGGGVISLGVPIPFGYGTNSHLGVALHWPQSAYIGFQTFALQVKFV